MFSDRSSTTAHSSQRSLFRASGASLSSRSDLGGMSVQLGDEEIAMELTRAKFEKLCESLCQKCLESVKSVLNDSKVAKDGVDEVVLVGGSTRIPRVQTILMVRSPQPYTDVCIVREAGVRSWCIDVSRHA
jgi:molecular chaperone DnaK (HSP70)